MTINDEGFKRRLELINRVEANRKANPNPWSMVTALIMRPDVWSETGGRISTAHARFADTIKAREHWKPDPDEYRRDYKAALEALPKGLQGERWSMFTTTVKETLNKLPHLDAHKNNEEGLLPHKSAFAQSVYLACIYRYEQLRKYCAENHSRWLTDEGRIVPFSDITPEEGGSRLDSSTADTDRMNMLFELSLLNDIADHDQFFIRHHRPGQAFLIFDGLGQPFKRQGDAGFNEADRQHLWRTAREDRITQPLAEPGQVGFNISTHMQQAIFLALCAEQRNLKFEQAIAYFGGTRPDEQVYLFDRKYLDMTRTYYVWKLLNNYMDENNGGLNADKDAIVTYFERHGRTPEQAAAEADETAEKYIKPALKESLDLMSGMLSSHLNPVLYAPASPVEMLLSDKHPDEALVTSQGVKIKGAGSAMRMLAFSVDAGKIVHKLLYPALATLHGHQPNEPRRAWPGCLSVEMSSALSSNNGVLYSSSNGIEGWSGENLVEHTINDEMNQMRKKYHGAMKDGEKMLHAYQLTRKALIDTQKRALYYTDLLEYQSMIRHRDYELLQGKPVTIRESPSLLANFLKKQGEDINEEDYVIRTPAIEEKTRQSLEKMHNHNNRLLKKAGAIHEATEGVSLDDGGIGVMERLRKTAGIFEQDTQELIANTPDHQAKQLALESQAKTNVTDEDKTNKKRSWNPLARLGQDKDGSGKPKYM